MVIPVMKGVLWILLVLVSFTSVSWAWDMDCCGRDSAPASPGAAQDHDSGSPADQSADPCGHCAHMESHLVGCIACYGFAVPDSSFVLHDYPLVVVPPPGIYPVFHPPRYLPPV